MCTQTDDSLYADLCTGTDCYVRVQTFVLVLRFLAGYGFVAERLKSDAVYFETDERRPRSEQGLQVRVYIQCNDQACLCTY
jgi:hypothetical protein